jgi:hypothetical protein
MITQPLSAISTNWNAAILTSIDAKCNPFLDAVYKSEVSSFFPLSPSFEDKVVPVVCSHTVDWETPYLSGAYVTERAFL